MLPLTSKSRRPGNTMPKPVGGRLTVTSSVLWDKRRDGSREKALAGLFRAMADGMERGETKGGAPNGGFWSVDIHEGEKPA